MIVNLEDNNITRQYIETIMLGKMGKFSNDWIVSD